MARLLGISFILSITFSLYGQIDFMEPKEVFSGYDIQGIDPFCYVGNLDNLGRSDLIVFNGGNAFSRFQLFTNDGENNFTDTLAETNFSQSFLYFGIADLDGDEITDLLFDKSYYTPTNAAEGFETQSYFEEGNDEIFAIGNGDIDDDGDIDVLFSGSDSFDPVSCFVGYNDGNGNFAVFDTLNTNYHFHPFTSRVPSSIRDFNGDGLVDILVYHNSNNEIVYTNPLIIYFQLPEGDFSPQTLPLLLTTEDAATGVFRTTTLQILDFDRDGSLDITYTNRNGKFIIYNNGLGEFMQIDTIFLGEKAQEIVDLDQDGSWELMVERAGEVGYISLDSTAQLPFNPENEILIYEDGRDSPGWTITTDIDGDNDLDILTSQTVRPSSRNVIFLFENKLFTTVDVGRQPQMMANLEIFPNPNQGQYIQLRLPAKLESGAFLRLHSSLGQVLQSYNVPSGVSQIELMLPVGLPTGSYFYTLYHSNGQMAAIGKFVHE